MKLMKNIPFTHVLAIGMLALVSLCIYAIRCGKKEAHAKVPAVLEHVIALDCNKRLGLTGMIHKPLGRKVKHVQITVNDSTETIHLKDSLDEAVANQLMLQHIMLKSNPPHPDTLNALLKKTLEERGVFTQASGVIYQYKGKKQYSNNDSTTMQSAFVTEAIYIDIKEWASVQAWMKCTPSTIISHILDSLKHAILIGAMVLVSAIIYAIFKRINDKQKSSHAALLEENEQYKAKEAVRAAYEKNLFGDTWQFEGMTLYQRTRTIHADGLSCTLPPNEFRLLWMFVTAPGNILCRTDIQDAFWPGHDTATNNMHGLIKHLRDSLEDFPDYQLKSLKGKKFKLVFGEDDNDDVSADD